MFDTEAFIAECRAAVAGGDSHKCVRDLVARAVSNPGPVIKALGEPARGAVQTLYNDADLTILNLVWAPRMTLRPHNHQMWAVIGLYTGREDNIFWRRTGENGEHVEAAGAKSLAAKETAPLGRDIIHSVTNPLSRCTGALHVYGGDFFAPGRSEWDPETLSEQPYNVARNMALFEEANALLASG